MTSPDPSPGRSPSPGTQQQLPHFPAGLEAVPDVSLEQQQQQEILDPTLDEQQQHQPGPPPPPFQPLFTLITDSTTRAAYHPRVHYIFSDDDPQLLTDALANHSYQQHALAAPTTELEPSLGASGGGDGGSGSGSSSRRPSLSHRPPPAPAAPSHTERAIILDLVPKKKTTSKTAAASHHDDPTSASTPTGYEVAWASSLSTDWAVVSTRLSPMADGATAAVPEDEVHPSESYEGAQQRLMMLRIEGVDIARPAFLPPTTIPARKSSTSTHAAAIARKPSPEERDLHMSGSGGVKQAPSPASIDLQGYEDYGSIVEEFDKRMAVLRRVVDAGMEREQKMTAAVAAELEDEDVGHHTTRGVGTHDWTGEQDQGDQGQERESGPGGTPQPPPV